jgi:hypothetical protein
MGINDLVQMRSLVRAETMDGALKPRQIFWCSRAHAEHYLQNRIAEVAQSLAGPKETPAAGPTELKKSLPEESAGLLTDSAPLPEHGTEPLLSVQQAAPVSPLVNPQRLTRRERRGRRK